MEYCCDALKQDLEYTCDEHSNRWDCHHCIFSYHDVYDEYSIIIHGQGGQIKMDYCPYCGTKFPESKLQEWFDTLENLLENFEGFGDERIPAAFKSSEWWKSKS